MPDTAGAQPPAGSDAEDWQLCWQAGPARRVEGEPELTESESHEVVAADEVVEEVVEESNSAVVEVVTE